MACGPLTRIHTFYSLSLLFRFLPRFALENHVRVFSFFFLLFTVTSSFNRRRAGETKSDSYDSSKMQFDVARLLLEAEGVVDDDNTREGRNGGSGDEEGTTGRKSEWAA